MEKHIIKYSCGCEHEIQNQITGMWESTGKQEKCRSHIPK